NGIGSNRIYGGNILNEANAEGNSWGRPKQFQFYYLGTSTLTLTSLPAFSMAFAAPNATVLLNTGAELKGAIVAKGTAIYSGAQVHYDTTLAGTGMVEELEFELTKIDRVIRQ
ncbi:MAG: hypothetical protein D6808_08040, partial [Candidatus Dadabacteria bacterium]